MKKYILIEMISYLKTFILFSINKKKYRPLKIISGNEMFGNYYIYKGKKIKIKNKYFYCPKAYASLNNNLILSDNSNNLLGYTSIITKTKKKNDLFIIKTITGSKYFISIISDRIFLNTATFTKSTNTLSFVNNNVTLTFNVYNICNDLQKKFWKINTNNRNFIIYYNKLIIQ